jgi:hypothetical protein
VLQCREGGQRHRGRPLSPSPRPTSPFEQIMSPGLTMDERELVEDLLSAYRAARERTSALREDWEASRPVLAEGSTGQVTVHPLHKALIEAERHEDQRRARLQGRPGPGRPTEVVLRPDSLPPGGKYPHES